MSRKVHFKPQNGWYWLFVSFLFLGLAAACGSGQASSAWSELPAAPEAGKLDSLDPVWDNQAQETSVDVRLYVEPYCRSNECAGYIRQVVLPLTGRADIRVRIYDYPLSQQSKAFMLSAVGWCLAEKGADKYLQFLEKSLEISDRYDNNLEIQILAKEIGGDYDRQCIRKATQNITAHFENKNLLGLKSVPATIINSRIVYGALSEQQMSSLIATAGQ